VHISVLKPLLQLVLVGSFALVAYAGFEKPPKQTTPVYGAHARMPRLLGMPDGGVLLSWIEPTAKGHVLKFAVQKQGVWLKQGVVTEGKQWFVNWADFHSVVAIDASFWVAHWLVKRAGGKSYDYDVELAITHDAGTTWQRIGRPYQDATMAEHGFVTIFAEDHQAGMVWLDGRNRAKKQSHADGTETPGNFALRYAQIQRDGKVANEQVLDSNTCTCCWTAVATTPIGAVAAWRGRTEGEIRDNRVAVLQHGRWRQPMPLGAEQWQIAGCPVNGPALAARGLHVVSAWFTAQGDQPRVRLAISKDGGGHFSAPVLVDEDAPIGRVSVVWATDNSAYVAWMRAPHQGGKKSWLMVRKMGLDGALSPPQKIAELRAGRDTGVPQMVATSQGLLFAWTHAAPNYGMHLQHVRWSELEAKSNVTTRPTFFNGSVFEAHNIPVTICSAPH